MSAKIDATQKQIHEIELGVALLLVAIEPVHENGMPDTAMLTALGVGSFDLAQALHYALTAAREREIEGETALEITEAAHSVAKALCESWRASR